MPFVQHRIQCCCLYLCLGLAGCASAPVQQVQTEPVVKPEPVAREAARANPLPVGRQSTVPAGAVVVLALEQAINSARVQPGDGFALRVAEPYMADGFAVIPAGAPAFGEVVHAQKAGSFGKPAELLLAVRWIEVHGERIEMRHFRPYQGQDLADAAANMSFVPVVGLFAPFIRGREIDLPAGTRALAQVRESITLSGTTASGLSKSIPSTSEPSPP